MRNAGPVLLACIVMVATSAARADTLSEQGRIPSGGVESVGFVAWRVDAADGSITEARSATAGLSARSQEALEIVPAWIRGDLADLLSRVSIVDQTFIADTILGLTDPRILDEVAYTFAYLAPEQLEASRPYLDLVVENAQWIYDLDPLLDYVTLVDEGIAGVDADWYTTAEYVVLVDGVETVVRLPRELYYATIVHPVLGGERLLRVLPPEGVHDPAGLSWRSYAWQDDGQMSYERPLFMNEPVRIEQEDLAAMDFGGPAATSVLTGPVRSYGDVIRDAASGDPVLLEFVGEGGGCCSDSVPNPNGHVFATTLALERAAAAGDDDLLRALLGAGPGNVALRPDLLASSSLGDAVDMRILVVRDRIPYGLGSDPVQDGLEALAIAPVDVVDSATFATLPLVTTAAPFMPDTYTKIVVPSDQPVELYGVLRDRADDLYEFVRRGGTFEFHGDSSEDWTDLEMPFGIDASPASVAGLEIGGFPLLSRVMQGASYLWDGQHAVLPGERAFDPGEGAVARVGWWIASNMTWRVAEMKVYRRDAALERGEQPARILYNHYGNCGELHFIFGAALRTVLVPTSLVGTSLDDHVWNEFHDTSEWIPFQATWSGGRTRLDDWGVAYDADTGNTKTISVMVGKRGDGYLENLLGRYPVTVDGEGLIDDDYSRHITLSASVVDAAGAPVDGARVIVISHYYYDPTGWYVGTWGVTGPDGTVDITVGEGNDYAVRVDSPMGTIPPTGGMDRWVSDWEAEAGLVFDRTFAYDGSGGNPVGRVPTLDVTERPLDPPDGEVLHLGVDVQAGRELSYGVNYLREHSWREPIGPATVDVMVLTAEEYDLLASGEPFTAGVLERDVSATSLEVALDPGGSDLFVVVANTGRVVNASEVSVELATFPVDPGEETGPEPADASTDVQEEGGGLHASGGCGCAIVS